MKGCWRRREGIPEQGNSLCKGTEAAGQSGFWGKARCSIWLDCRLEKTPQGQREEVSEQVRIRPR